VKFSEVTCAFYTVCVDQHKGLTRCTVLGGDASVATLEAETEALNFVDETYKHCKAIAATGAGVGL
jgi:hypothetical protein